MKFSHKFFKSLKKHLGLIPSERFLQELKDHSEDRKTNQQLKGNTISPEKNLEALGDPKHLASTYKKIFWKDSLQYIVAIGIFLSVFACIEITFIYFDNTASSFIEFFTLVGLFLYIMALPVVFISIIFDGISNLLFGYTATGDFPFIRFFLTPLLLASFYTFLYFVFFCKPFWGKNKSKILTHF